MLSIISYTMVAQERRFENFEQINAMRIAMITKKMDLSSEQAQKFWPLYNAYEADLKTIEAEEKSFFEKNKNKKKLSQFLAIRASKQSTLNAFVENLKKFLSDEKILTLFQAEQQFNEMLVNKVKARMQKQ